MKIMFLLNGIVLVVIGVFLVHSGWPYASKVIEMTFETKISWYGMMAGGVIATMCGAIITIATIINMITGEEE